MKHVDWTHVLCLYLCGMTCACASEDPVVCQLDGSRFSWSASRLMSHSSGARLEEKSSSVSDTVVHVGPDTNEEKDGIGDVLSYKIRSCYDNREGKTYSFEAIYSDDVGGNGFDVLMDEKLIGSFETETTGGWDSFTGTGSISGPGLDVLEDGEHTLQLIMTRGGSWGVIFDYFKMSYNVIDMSELE